MPNVPTYNLDTTQAQRMLRAHGGSTAEYLKWRRRTDVLYVLEHELAEVDVVAKDRFAALDVQYAAKRVEIDEAIEEKKRDVLASLQDPNDPIDLDPVPSPIPIEPPLPS
jgi:hypothetical protein